MIVGLAFLKMALYGFCLFTMFKVYRMTGEIEKNCIKRAILAEYRIPEALMAGHLEGLREVALSLAGSDSKDAVRDELHKRIDKLTKEVDQKKGEFEKWLKAQR